MSTENLLDDRTSTVAPHPKKVARRNRLFMLLFGIALLLALAAGVHWWTVGRYVEETDNAYVGGNVVPIAARAAGTVREVTVGNTQYVKAGQVLVLLDDTDAQAALTQAQARLVQVKRQARSASYSNAMYAAAVDARTAELKLAEQMLKARSGASVEVVSTARRRSRRGPGRAASKACTGCGDADRDCCTGRGQHRPALGRDRATGQRGYPAHDGRAAQAPMDTGKLQGGTSP
jgi:multidrug resistance efflux pump